MGNTIPWGKLEITDSMSLDLSDNQSISITKHNNELLICKNNNGEVTEDRYITGNENNIYIEPGLPDMPIILKPSQNISILPSRRLDAYIEVPFLIRIFYGTKQKKVFLCEVVIQHLSRSFFGNPDSGEFAYFLESPLRCNISDYENNGFNIYCPLAISNKSLQNLEFEKMIFRVPYLSIYRSDDVLIASPVNITFRGQDQISQIVYKKTLPVTGDSAALLAQPRQEEDKNLLRKSFYFIKNLYTG